MISYQQLIDPLLKKQAELRFTWRLTTGRVARLKQLIGVSYVVRSVPPPGMGFLRLETCMQRSSHSSWVVVS